MRNTTAYGCTVSYKASHALLFAERLWGEGGLKADPEPPCRAHRGACGRRLISPLPGSRWSLWLATYRNAHKGDELCRRSESRSFLDYCSSCRARSDSSNDTGGARPAMPERRLSVEGGQCHVDNSLLIRVLVRSVRGCAPISARSLIELSSPDQAIPNSARARFRRALHIHRGTSGLFGSQPSSSTSSRARRRPRSSRRSGGSTE